MFSVSEDVIREEYDDLSDLDNEQMERVKEWEQQLSGKQQVLGDNSIVSWVGYDWGYGNTASK